MFRNKRVNFSEADCHLLLDLVYKFKDIIECKKCDGPTLKEKVMAWGKIATIYNTATTEPRTLEQLRVKYDNLKKEVRRYKSQLRQNQLDGGGGVVALRKKSEELYDKICTMISLSADATAPIKSNSIYIIENADEDIKEENYENTALDDVDSSASEWGATEYMEEAKEEISDNGCRQPQFNAEGVTGASEGCEEIFITSSTAHERPSFEVPKNWSNFSSKTLKSQNNELLKRAEEEVSRCEFDKLKRKLLIREAEREEETHKRKMEMEQEQHRMRMEMDLKKHKREMEREEDIHRKNMEMKDAVITHNKVMMKLQEQKLKIEIALLQKNLAKD